jgi:DNA repair protein RadC
MRNGSKQEKMRINDETKKEYRPEVYRPESAQLQTIARKSINATPDVYELLQNFKNEKQEHFITILINTRNQVIDFRVLFIGTLDISVCHPRDVFNYAVSNNAAKIIIAHNHPSGNLEPSQNDIQMTNRMREAGEIMGISVVDSVIISEEGYRSIILRAL